MIPTTPLILGEKANKLLMGVLEFRVVSCDYHFLFQCLLSLKESILEFFLELMTEVPTTNFGFEKVRFFPYLKIQNKKLCSPDFW